MFHRKKPKPVVVTKETEKEKEKYYGRVIDTSRGGPNMPKYQPCPECGRGCKRDSKTTTGAWYYCIKCDLRFFEHA